jgi:hypothetical protein
MGHYIYFVLSPHFMLFFNLININNVQYKFKINSPYTPIYISNKPTKKYMVKNPEGKYVHFGEMGFQDFTRHMDKSRQDRYLKRAMNISGNWYENPYSPNNLAIHLLWM